MLAGAQILAEIDAFIMRVARLALRKLAGLLEPFDNMILAEAAAQRGGRECPFVEAYQMLNWSGNTRPISSLMPGTLRDTTEMCLSPLSDSKEPSAMKWSSFG